MRTSPSIPNERGSALVITLAMLLLLVVIGTSLLALSGVDTVISRNDEHAEGALHAAESGVHLAVDRLEPDPIVSVQPIPEQAVGTGYTTRSGSRRAPGPEPQSFVGVERVPGFSINVGTGYNPSGYRFARYRLNATGVGPGNARREVEAMTHYGPVAQ